MFEKDGLPCFIALFTLAGFFALLFLELDFEVGCFGELLGEDCFSDAAPECKGFICKLLLFWGKNFGGDVKRRNVYDGILMFRRDGFLGRRQVRAFGPMERVFAFQKSLPLAWDQLKRQPFLAKGRSIGPECPRRERLVRASWYRFQGHTGK